MIVDVGSSGDSGSVTVQLTSVGSITVGGASVQAAIGTDEQPELFAFSATAGQTVAVAAASQTFTQSSGATLGIEDASGAPQGPIQFVGVSAAPAYAEATIARSGTYYVALRPASATATGKAKLSLASAAPAVTALIGGPAVTVGIKAPGVPGTATFAGTAGETVAVLVSATTFTGDSTRLYVTTSDGTPVGPDQYLNGSSSANGPVTLPSTGTYTVVIDPNPGPAGTGAVGSVTFSLIQFTQVSRAAAIDGPAVTATVTRPTQQARITFTAAANQKVVVGYSANSLTRIGDRISLTGPGGTTVDSPAILSSASGFLPPATLPSAGTYTVLVDPSYAGDTGSITISVKSITDITGTITPGTPVTAKLTVTGQRAFYRFTTTAASTSATIALSGSTFTSSDSVSVIDGTGATVGSRYPATDGTAGPVTLATAGTYQVVVDPTTGNDETGTVTLTLSLTAPSPGAPALRPAPVPGARPAGPVSAHPRNGSRAVSPVGAPGPTLTMRYHYYETDSFTDYSQGNFSTYNDTATWTQAGNGAVSGTGSIANTSHSWLGPDVCITMDTADVRASGTFRGPLSAGELFTYPSGYGATGYTIMPDPVTVTGTQHSQNRDDEGANCSPGDASSSAPYQGTMSLGWIEGTIPAGQTSASGHSGCGTGVSSGGFVGFSFTIVTCSLDWTVTLPGCDHLTAKTDGKYAFSGCFFSGDAGASDYTTQLSNVDGLDVSASPSDTVTYKDGPAVGYSVVSAGPSTVSLNLAGTRIPIYTGTIGYPLTAPITVTLPSAPAPGGPVPHPGEAAKSTATKIAGLTISGQLKVTPAGRGSAKVSAAVTLPPVLGGGQGTLTGTTTVDKGLSSVQVTVKKASFLQLLRLSALTLTWQAGSGGTQSWSVAATASAGGKKATSLTGRLTYRGNTLASADLSVSNFSLAGLAKVSSLHVGYSPGHWTGSAVLGTGKSAAKADLHLIFGAAGLTSGSVSAANVPVFGVLDVRTFKLSYGSDTWSIDFTAADGGGVSGSMTATEGLITAARLTVRKVSFLGKFTIGSAAVSYARQSPNSECPKVSGYDIWCGGWQVQLPSASVIAGVSGTLAVADDSFVSGSIDVRGNVPLLDGIVLTDLHGSADAGPPVTISGWGSLRFGPAVRGTSLLAVTGNLARELPGGRSSGSYQLDGTLSALGKLTGHVHVTVPGDGSATKIVLTARAKAGPASAVGTLSGWFTASSLTLTGKVVIHVPGLTVNGVFRADKKGMAACGSYRPWPGSRTYQAGFEYDWNGGLVIDKTGCSEAGF